MTAIVAYSNPYFGQDLLGFFMQLSLRLVSAAKGEIGFTDLATDEVQMLVLVGVSCSAALVGTFLTLRRMTMLANALSHTILLGIVAVFLLFRATAMTDEHGHLALNLQAMLLASLGMGVITTFLTEFLTNTLGLQEDASTGVVFSSLFALGVILVTAFTRNAHIGTEVVMGNVDALHVDDLVLVYVILLINLLVFSLFYKEFKVTTFDAGLSRALGISTTFFNYLLMVQVSMTAVGAFRAVGVLMVLAFITGPVLAARMLTHRLKTLITLACAIGGGCSVLGVAVSRHLLSVYGVPLSTGGIVVCLIVAAYLLIAISVLLRGRLVARA